jgi:hypothetical protein
MQEVYSRVELSELDDGPFRTTVPEQVVAL